MPTVSIDEAVTRIEHEIATFAVDGLIEVYGELFPETPRLRDQPRDRGELLSAILEQMHRGVEPEAVVDLWNVVFPKDRNVWYDDENNLIQYNGEPLWIE